LSRITESAGIKNTFRHKNKLTPAAEGSGEPGAFPYRRGGGRYPVVWKKTVEKNDNKPDGKLCA